MPRLTISLTERAHSALKETATLQNRSMGSIIEESLELRSAQVRDAARKIIAKARAQSGLSEYDAMNLAIKETKLHREGR